MYTPNEHVDAAHQRWCQVTWGEDAGTPPQDHVAPAQRSDARQHRPQASPSLQLERLHTTRPVLSPTLETHVFADRGGAYFDYSPGWQEVDENPLQGISRSSQHHSSSPPLRSRSFQPLVPIVNHLSLANSGDGYVSYLRQYDLAQTRAVPNGLPLRPDDFHPQSSGQFASDLNFPDVSIWNTDGSGGNQDQRPFDDLSHAGRHRQPNMPEFSVEYTTGSGQPRIYQFVTLQAGQTRRNSSVVSSPVFIQDHSQTTQLPAIQEWRTDNLTKHSKPSRKKPDAATRRKQEKYRQTGEVRRNTTATGMGDKQTLADRTSLLKATAEPKRAKRPPIKRRKVAATYSNKAHRRSQLELTSHQGLYNYQGYADLASSHLELQSPAFQLSIAEIPWPAADELPQDIVSKYEDYKWSAYHYELHSQGYDFAQSWFQQLFDTILNPDCKERHFSHFSKGFIKDGNRRSIIVLHNAANPFEYDPTPKSTITIGVYGYHWYEHSEIHWTTLASDQRHLLALCLQQCCLVEKYKWTHDAKPTEKRFHRAYWLAANQQHIKGLLNRGPSEDRPHDLVEEKSEEDPDKDFSISEADLTNDWDVTDAGAVAAWEMVQNEVKALGAGFDVSGADWEHTVTASSEW